MPEKKDIQHSVLIVSGSEQFEAYVKKALPPGCFLSLDSFRSASAARRNTLSRDYSVAVINIPLPGENGLELAKDLAEEGSISVLIAVPGEIFDEVSEGAVDMGIHVISKPVSAGDLGRTIRLLIAIQNRMHELKRKTEILHEKMEELRVISKAKIVLVEKRHMTEDEAHRYIGKQAMDHSVSRRIISEWILDEEEY
ncbi:MAG: ANTAR domain-containing protein [Lachnospiraceae bacterium]|nr:ANTAR domain-containing protein [Lachnospiraceae bacterium]